MSNFETYLNNLTVELDISSLISIFASDSSFWKERFEKDKYLTDEDIVEHINNNFYNKKGVELEKEFESLKAIMVAEKNKLLKALDDHLLYTKKEQEQKALDILFKNRMATVITELCKDIDSQARKTSDPTYWVALDQLKTVRSTLLIEDESTEVDPLFYCNLIEKLFMQIDAFLADLHKEIKKSNSPENNIQNMAEMFAKLGVTPEMLQVMLQDNLQVLLQQRKK